MVYCLLHLIHLYYLDSWILFFLYTKTGANYCIRREEQLISRTLLSFVGKFLSCVQSCKVLGSIDDLGWQEELRLRAVTWERGFCMAPWPPSAWIGSRHAVTSHDRSQWAQTEACSLLFCFCLCDPKTFRRRVRSYPLTFFIQRNRSRIF